MTNHTHHLQKFLSKNKWQVFNAVYVIQKKVNDRWVDDEWFEVCKTRESADQCIELLDRNVYRAIVRFTFGKKHGGLFTVQDELSV